ncbi:MAG: nicotinate (nicotinamide) nucleotide adenylyltransferase [Planctomycetota bacterium]
MTNVPATAIFGGSFDPVHLGHLWIAETALEALPVDQIRWMPAATSPLKPEGPVVKDRSRLQMLQLAIGGLDGHVVDDWELKQGDVSYTVETLRHLRDEVPERDLFLIIGADSLASWGQWHEPAEILSLAMPAVVARGGDPPPDYRVLQPFASSDVIDTIRGHEIMMPQIEISSREIRSRIAANRSIRFRVPHPVAALIEAQNLYRPKGETGHVGSSG